MTDFTLPELGENITSRRRAARPGQARRHDRERSAGPRARNRQGDDRSALVGRRQGEGDQGQGRRQGQGRPGDPQRRGRRRGRRAAPQAGARKPAPRRRRRAEAAGRQRRPRREAAPAPTAAQDKSRTSGRDIRPRTQPTAAGQGRREGSGGRTAGQSGDADGDARRTRQKRRRHQPRRPRAEPTAAAAARRSCRRRRPRRRCAAWRASSASTSTRCRHGAGGRISIDDVKAHAKRLVDGGAGRGGAARRPSRCPTSRAGATVERQPMRAVRRKTAEHLSAAWATIPHVTQHDLADITGARGAAQAATRSRWRPPAAT